MLRLKNVSKQFNQIQVLSQFSCEVEIDDFIVVMGPNGAGKSTLFDLISGKTAPDQGMIQIDGEDVTFWPEKKRASAVGRLFQNTHLGSCSHLTIRENLSMANLKEKRAGLRLGIKNFPEEAVEEILRPLNLNLERLMDVPMGALSGGQRQIISFAMATLKPPKILLLDEPTAALDSESATQLLTFAKGYAKKHRIPILLITHDPLVAKHLGNRLWILKGGKIETEFGIEKKEMDPQEFFHPIHYDRLLHSL